MKVCKDCKIEFPVDNFYKKSTRCKSCDKAKAIAWRKSNPNRVKVHEKKRNKKVWEKQKNDKEYIDKKKAYRASRREAYNNNAKRWNVNNRDRQKINNKLWRMANPEKNRLAVSKRRAYKKGNGYAPYTEQQIFDLYGTNCYMCDMPIDLNAPRQPGKPGWRSGLHIEHFIDLNAGGPDTLENVRPSHGWCNLSKGRIKP